MKARESGLFLFDIRIAEGSLTLMRNVIRILAILGCVGAIAVWLQLKNIMLIFTAIAFFLTFLGTFLFNKVKQGNNNIAVNQRGGAFSKNSQTVNINKEPRND